MRSAFHNGVKNKALGRNIASNLRAYVGYKLVDRDRAGWNGRCESSMTGLMCSDMDACDDRDCQISLQRRDMKRAPIAGWDELVFAGSHDMRIAFRWLLARSADHTKVGGRLHPSK